jgi:CO/xanthine dehydrogenase Mo-binding subunit
MEAGASDPGRTNGEVELIIRPEAPSLGAGEASQGPMVAAIANAFAAATGKRMRELPLTPERERR